MTDRELDEAVRVHVYGWDPATARETERLIHYSTHIEHAWLVVEEMRRRGWWFRLHYDDDLSCATFACPGRPSGEGVDPRAPFAISIAALRALGVEVQP